MTERGYVVGDLHLGAGQADPLEDFQDDAQFAMFCERIAGPETTLILNGDIIDFAQIPPYDIPEDSRLLWTEEASLDKLKTALSAHPEFFASLARMLTVGARVHFLIGNHDLDMVWPKVQERMAAVLGRPPRDALSFSVGATVFHGVHIEHGHHFTPENCPREPTRFIHEGPGGKLFLERVWGTDFMLQFYNQLEHDYPFADNVKPMLAILWHGLRNRWVGGRELVRLFLFLKKRGIPWSGLESTVLAAPTQLTPSAAAAALEDPEWKSMILERMRSDAGFVSDLQNEFVRLPPSERAIAAAPEKVEVVAPQFVTERPVDATLGLFREDRELRAARDRLAAPGVTHVVFGHTHAAVNGGLDGRLFNYGTWLKKLDIESEHVKTKIKSDGLTLDMLKDDRLYTVERRAVRIDADPHYASRVRLVTDEEP